MVSFQLDSSKKGEEGRIFVVQKDDSREHHQMKWYISQICFFKYVTTVVFILQKSSANQKGGSTTISSGKI